MNQVGGSSSTPEQLNQAVRQGTRVAAIGVVASALLATTKIAAGVIGVFTLLRKRALMSDALSHATLPGIGLAFIIANAFGVT